MQLPRAEAKLVGAAGEHWVAAVLTSRGWSAALTRDGVSRSDVLAVESTGDAGRRMIEVQVKTSRKTKSTSWLLGRKTQTPALSDREWFALVELPPLGEQGNPQLPRTFIVPRDHLAAATIAIHQAWLDAPGKQQDRHASFDLARVRADQAWAGYEDRWDLLSAPSTEAPVLLPPELRSVIEKSRLPDGHPWRTELPSW